MFGISFYELLIILIIAIILFKPSEFISILFNLGLIIKKIKKFTNKFKDDIYKVTNLGDLNNYEVKNKNSIIKQDLPKNDINQ